MKTIYNKLLFLLLLLPTAIFAQGTLTGTVLDKANGETLPGVNIVIQGSSTGVSTDFDGKFSLSNIKSGDVVVFSYIGYKDFTLAYQNQTSITVSLEGEANQLSEVVVQVGYGTVRRKDATGSVTTVTEKDFNKGSIMTTDQLLTGKAAGVRITNNGGGPDSGTNIRIRGGASLSASSSPLIVIDGIPVSNVTPAGVANPLSLINPNDVASITILKDASASAIYGSRASNGVIIIVTKSGASSGVKFNYSANVTSGKVGETIDVMNGEEFVRFIQQYHPTYTNLLGIDDPSNELTDDLATSQIEGRIITNTDWQDQIFRTSISTDHNLSARANLYGKIPFRASIGYTRNEGLVKTNDYERYSYSIKVTPTLMDNHLRIDMNAKGILTDKNVVNEGDAIRNATDMDPTKPVFDNSPNNIFDGYFQETTLNGNKYILQGPTNPLALLEQRKRPERVLRFLGNLEFDYKLHFFPDLRAVVNVGLDASQSRIRETFEDNSIATYTFDNTNPDPETNYHFNPGKSYLENQHMTNTTWDSYLVYTKSLTGFLRKFDLQGGYSYQNFKNDGNKEIYRNNIDTGYREVDPNEGNPNNRYFNELNLQSFFGRTNINLSDRYLVTLSFRADASSLFAEEKRWGYFPAAAIAWKVKEESFLKNVSLINDLKIRVGWGKTGQQDIADRVGYYPSTPLFDIASGSSQYLEGASLYSAKPYNDQLTWEKTTTYNLGLDFDFFKKSILFGSFDIYKRETTDLLARVTLPPGQSIGDTFVKNVGSTEGKGFELNLNIQPLNTENYSFVLNTNVAYNYTEVTDLEGVLQINDDASRLPFSTGLFVGRHAVGQEIGSFWVLEQLYDAAGNAVVGSYVDRNDDGLINDNDRYYKAKTPNWTYGFGFNFNYKNWDLGTSFRGQIGGQVYNTKEAANGFRNHAIPPNSLSLNNVLDFYSGAADPNFETINDPIPLSDYFLEDASFLRCETIVLGYKFPNFLKNSALRIYGAVNNAFIVTDYSGQDPEVFNGIDTNFYPRPRMYTFGLSLDF